MYLLSPVSGEIRIIHRLLQFEVELNIIVKLKGVEMFPRALNVKYQIKITCLVIVLILCSSCSDDKKGDDTQSHVETISVRPPFDEAADFSCGLGLVQMGQWGYTDDQVRQYYIDRNGRVVLAPEFDSPFSVSAFSEDLALINIGFTDRTYHSGGKFGYIDKTGEVVIAPQLDYAEDFSEGLARVRVIWLVGMGSISLISPLSPGTGTKFASSLCSTRFTTTRMSRSTYSNILSYITRERPILIFPAGISVMAYLTGSLQVRYCRPAATLSWL